MEQVKHPTHYNLDGRKECWDEMEEVFGKDATIMFCTLSAYKYLYRAGKKGSAEKDLQKAGMFLGHAYDVNNRFLSNTQRAENFKHICKCYKMLDEKREEHGQDDNPKQS